MIAKSLARPLILATDLRAPPDLARRVICMSLHGTSSRSRPLSQSSKLKQLLDPSASRKPTQRKKKKATESEKPRKETFDDDEDPDA